MYLTRLQVEGFRGAEHATVEQAGRVVPLPAGVGGCALADAIDLLAAGLDTSRLKGMAERLGWTTQSTSIVGLGADAELADLHPPSVSAVVADGQRSVTIEGTLALDPPMYGRLRAHAARDPRMVTALGQDPSVTVKVGWLFSQDRSNAHPSVLFVRIGGVGFETTGKDRPSWVPELLVELGTRFRRIDPFEPISVLAERLLAATLSPDPRVRAGFERARIAVGLAPFDLPSAGLVRAGDRLDLVFGPDLVRLRQLGRAAADALRFAEAAYVLRPDVLVVQEPSTEGVRSWFEALTDADDAPVEQVWLA